MSAFRKWDNLVEPEAFEEIVPMVKYLVDAAPTDQTTLTKAMVRMRRQIPFKDGKTQAKKSQLLHVFSTLVARNELEVGSKCSCT